MTNVPAQALLMMNDPFVVQSAKRFADRALSEDLSIDDTMRISWMWQQALGRRPTEYESQFAASYLSDAAQRIADLKTASEKLSLEIKQLEIAKGRLIEAATHESVECGQDGKTIRPGRLSPNGFLIKREIDFVRQL